jgi:hypothetical protein
MFGNMLAGVLIGGTTATTRLFEGRSVALVGWVREAAPPHLSQAKRLRSDNGPSAIMSLKSSCDTSHAVCLALSSGAPKAFGRKGMTAVLVRKAGAGAGAAKCVADMHVPETIAADGSPSPSSTGAHHGLKAGKGPVA